MRALTLPAALLLLVLAAAVHVAPAARAADEQPRRTAGTPRHGITQIEEIPIPDVILLAQILLRIDDGLIIDGAWHDEYAVLRFESTDGLRSEIQQENIVLSGRQEMLGIWSEECPVLWDLYGIAYSYFVMPGDPHLAYVPNDDNVVVEGIRSDSNSFAVVYSLFEDESSMSPAISSSSSESVAKLLVGTGGARARYPIKVPDISERMGRHGLYPVAKLVLLDEWIAAFIQNVDGLDTRLYVGNSTVLYQPDLSAVRMPAHIGQGGRILPTTVCSDGNSIFMAVEGPEWWTTQKRPQQLHIVKLEGEAPFEQYTWKYVGAVDRYTDMPQMEWFDGCLVYFDRSLYLLGLSD